MSSIGYNLQMLIVNETDVFSDWLSALADNQGRARMTQRIQMLRLGHWGDTEAVGEGVLELRVHVGPGYRIYCTREQNTVVLLLCGGDKSSQKRDIARAQTMRKAINKSIAKAIHTSATKPISKPIHPPKR